MEVHHAHHPSHKKKWTEYLLEFFMLFIAVFLGFIAENIREHKVESNRAKELTVALIRDFARDTAELSRLSGLELLQQGRIDTLNMFLKLPFNQIPQQDFYRLIRQIQVSFAFVHANATENQLKNAGYLRYFSKDSLSGLLSEYDFLLRDNEGQDQIVTSMIYDKYYNLISRTLDPDLMNIQFSDTLKMPALNGIKPIGQQDLLELRNLLVLLRRSHSAYISSYAQLKTKATGIMNYLTD